jgi:hypothetical protein
MEGRKGGVQNSNVNYTPPPPPNPAFDNVQSGNEWFCVLCDYILPHTPHVDKATTCINTIWENE